MNVLFIIFVDVQILCEKIIDITIDKSIVDKKKSEKNSSKISKF